jgi:hypothetical protein
MLNSTASASLRDRLEQTVNTLDDYQWRRVCDLTTKDIIRNNIAIGKHTSARYVFDVMQSCVRLLRTHLLY